jgi:polyhydroxyalkanoate synthesis regulator phasin
MNTMRKYAAVGVTAGVLAGGALGVGLSATGLTAAAPPVIPTAPPVMPAQETSDEETWTHPRRDQIVAHLEAMAAHRQEKYEQIGERLEERLSPLVEEGVLSEEQVEAVIERLRTGHAERAAQMRAKISERLSHIRGGHGPGHGPGLGNGDGENGNGENGNGEPED